MNEFSHQKMAREVPGKHEWKHNSDVMHLTSGNAMTENGSTEKEISIQVAFLWGIYPEGLSR